MEILRKEVLLARNEDVMFNRRHDVREAACLPVHSRSSEHVFALKVQRVMCLGKPKVY